MLKTQRSLEKKVYPVNLFDRARRVELLNEQESEVAPRTRSPSQKSKVFWVFVRAILIC